MRFPHVVLLSACALIWTATLLAQSPNGVINGLVIDPSNRIIVGADVVVVNDVTGLKYTTKTNDEGIYVLPNLPPGPYRLQVSKIGFKTTIKPDIVLNLQDALSINFTLPIGASYETVTVEAGASMINTTDASVSTVVDQTYVKNMPLNGRSFQDLILLTPGIVTQTPQPPSTGTTGLGRTGEFSVNGQRTESNYYSVDGVSSNVGAAAGETMINVTGGSGSSGSLPASTALGTTQALVSVDDLLEFRVQSSTYSAEYGRNPGGQFAFETKSGTNQWHGTAYDYLRNGYFDAADWFDDHFGVKKAALRQNDFGGTLGGPIRIPGLYDGDDRSFFFVSYEGLRLTAPQAAESIFVPDATLRANTPAPLGQVLNAWPIPSPGGIDDTVNGFAQFIGSWSDPSSLNSTSVRFDHVVNDRLRLFFRFSDTGSQSATRGPFGDSPTLVSMSVYSMRTYTAGVSSVFSNRFSNEFRLNYSSNEVTGDSVVEPFGGSTPVDLRQVAGLGPGSQTLVGLFYGESIFLSASSSSGAQKQWNLVDTVGVSWGRHQFKFGADFRRLAPFSQPVNPDATWDYFDKNEVEANSAGFSGVFAFAPGYPLYTNSSVFAQDQWKMSRRLSFSLGLRWEVNPAPGVTRGIKPYTIQFQGTGPDTWTLAPQGRPLWRTTWYNFAPRLGAAYVLHDAPGWETVLRSGGGVFYDTGQQLGSGGVDSQVGFYGQSPFCFSCSFPGNPSALIPVIVNPPVPPWSYVFGFSTHLQLPYTLQWNASVEQGLGNSQVLTVSYVGSHGSRLLRQNQFSSATNPNTGLFFVVQNGLTSDYNSLQVQYRRRLLQGLTALASYTWSHCLDYGSQNFAFGYERGNCDFDVRHNLSAAFSYDLPNVRDNGFASAVLHHWGLDDRVTARTAFPVTLSGNVMVDPTTGRQFNAGLDLVPGQPTYLYGADCASVLQGLGDLPPGQGCPGGRAIDPNGFVNVISGLGDAPRNFVRGFGAWQMDAAVRRDFPIRGPLKLQFRAEAFNIFNHPNFGTVNSNFGQKTFGQATGTLATSLGILSPIYQMGGPRSMQFALKLVF
jgi:hypothetical protein